MMSVSILEKGGVFDVDARMPPRTTNDQYRQMLRGLLADRFGLVVHREKREGPIYRLEINKNQPKLTASPDLPPGTEPTTSLQLGPKGEDGFAKTPPGYSGFLVTVSPDSERVRNKFMRTGMSELAVWLWQRIRKPISDHTQLQGRYDFYLEYSRNEGAASLFEALPTQLGLKLVSAQGEFEMLVVDRSNRTPTPN